MQKVTDEVLEKAAEHAVRAAARMVARAAMDLVYVDPPHDWSSHPCATCRMVSSLLGFDYGCDRYRREKGLS